MLTLWLTNVIKYEKAVLTLLYPLYQIWCCQTNRHSCMWLELWYWLYCSKMLIPISSWNAMLLIGFLYCCYSYANCSMQTVKLSFFLGVFLCFFLCFFLEKFTFFCLFFLFFCFFFTKIFLFLFFILTLHKLHQM